MEEERIQKKIEAAKERGRKIRAVLLGGMAAAQKHETDKA